MTAWAIGAFLLMAMIVRAQPTSASSISFQGALSGANGQPLANGNYYLTFKFYTNAITATALATSNVPNVPITNGVASTPILVEVGWFNGQTRYLGISITNGTELSPRVLMTAVPYAIKANTASDENGKLYVPNEVYARSGNPNYPAFSVRTYEGETTPIANWLGTGVSANFHKAIGSPWAPSLGLGFVVGDQIESTIVSAYKEFNRSGFQVRGVAYQGSPVGAGSEAWFTVRSTGIGVFTETPQAALDVNGTTRTKILQITGGADLAEHLSVTDTNPRDEFKVEPGMVVSIDPSGNRRFKLSDEAYDRKRVGIISGGNGVQPGLILRDEGNPQADGEQPIALTGQVWCHADASFGPITPGDLLTTSATPGHAMNANDDTKARFAVLGQALTGLAEGRGWVQVLVGKQ